MSVKYVTVVPAPTGLLLAFAMPDGRLLVEPAAAIGLMLESARHHVLLLHNFGDGELVPAADSDNFLGSFWSSDIDARERYVEQTGVTQSIK